MEQNRGNIVVKSIIIIIVLIALAVLGGLFFQYFTSRDKTLGNENSVNQQWEMNQTELQNYQVNNTQEQNPINTINTIDETAGNNIVIAPNGQEVSNQPTENLKTQKLLSNSYYYSQLNEARKNNL